ncbi:hypothetical protein F5148DRAFT_1147755 [Russula earlei]|uniref:Uncharacterized protein n=1 Tax=Russula earlei TaxID=71964 RepID=A0ACC0UG25_9AGAM|nr:hypothetical protein F5148DRAFT_1147755 [Russula earlei]
MAYDSLATYILALLELMGRKDGSVDNPPLGLATPAGAISSTFDVPAHKLLHALIEHSPSPETISREFMVELARCEISAVKQLGDALLPLSVDDLDRDHSVSPSDWASIVHQELRQTAGNTTYLTALASHYFSHLIVAFRNPGGKKTPQESIHPTPDLGRIDEIESLLSARAVKPRCAHIIPFSVHSKTQSHQAIETFTGTILKAGGPWGIEATLVNDQPIARVFAASGVAEVFDQYLEDDDDYMLQVPVYFGGPFVDDDTLMPNSRARFRCNVVIMQRVWTRE